MLCTWRSASQSKGLLLVQWTEIRMLLDIHSRRLPSAHDFHAMCGAMQAMVQRYEVRSYLGKVHMLPK